MSSDVFAGDISHVSVGFFYDVFAGVISHVSVGVFYDVFAGGHQTCICMCLSMMYLQVTLAMYL